MQSKIQGSHRERLAYVYVRQSTLQQVRDNHESRERQYQLSERALELGWSKARVEIIDEDQGRSGSSALRRPGFQRLVSDLSLGKVGLVLMLEASRLARNNSDWHRLIELCGLSHSLIADESSVYDPREPNDRLLLGVKGTLSEAELFTLRTRLHEGRWNKARKGQLAFTLPVGYVRDEDGAWALDPDVQVRERLAYLFALFGRLKVARRVVLELRQQGLSLPTRLTQQEGYGSLVWKTASLSAVVRLLSNPAYAGAYVYGRWDYEGQDRYAKTGKAKPKPLPMCDWKVKLFDHHSAYISWEDFVQNRQQLRQNAFQETQAGAPREGAALLQGIVTCGFCGRRMGLQHRAKKEKRASSYICDRGYQDGDAHICQSISSHPVDAAVVAAFLEATSPLSLDIALQVVQNLEQELTDKQRQWQLQVKQARYEARLAQRQYDAIDPDNRLVAAELEKRWEEKLARLAQLEQAFAQAEQQAQWQLSDEDRKAVATLSRDLPAIWQAASTSQAERKQLLRLAIASVQLDGRSQAGKIEVQIHWHTKAVTRQLVDRPAPGEGSLKTPPEAVTLIHQLAAEHSYAEIAQALNAAGWRTAFGRAFNTYHVGYICRRDGMGRAKVQAKQRPEQERPAQTKHLDSKHKVE